MKQECIFELNYISNIYKEIFSFEQPFTAQPILLQINESQDILMAASVEDGYLYNSTTGKQYDIDAEFDIGIIKCIVFDEEDGMIYMCCNRRHGVLGMFLIKFYQYDPDDHEFVLSRTAGNRSLDIDSVSLTIIKGEDEGSKRRFKEIIIGYKTIYINTFCVEVNDISNSDANNKTITSMNHESFQLWESDVHGFVIEGSKDFVILNKTGMNVIALGQQSKRALVDNHGMNRMIHSLDSYSYLKIDKHNMLNFKC